VKFRGLLRHLFPTPRRPVSGRDVWPLLLFLTGFATLCFCLEASQSLLFTRPAALGLIAVSGWLWWLSIAGWSGLPERRAVASLCVRMILTGGLVMALAEPRAVRSRDVVSVVYALDVSDSIGSAAVDQALGLVARHVQEKPSQDEAGLVVFGGSAAVELPPATSFPFEGVVTSRVQRDATDIEQALSLSAAMLPEENRGRIVLISDGTATSGSLNSLLQELRARDITVDVLPIEYQYDREVWIERLELPQSVRIGQDYDASIVLSALQEGRGRLTLRQNGRAIAESSVEFQPGKNRYSLPIRLAEPGYFEYQASVEVAPEDDHLRQNNSVLNYLYVEGEGRVLVVTDPSGDERDSSSLLTALRSTGRLVDAVTAFEFPHDTLSLMPYDCVVWVNVPRDAFDDAQMRALHDSVRDLGTGFLMVGGPGSYGPGGYHRTLVEAALPVSMDVSQKKVLPKGALVIVLHTCEFPEGNMWGKRITQQAIRVLTAQDEVGVLVYGLTGEQWLFRLTPAAEYENLIPMINGAEIGDMLTFSTTMQMGLEELKKSDASTRHMIIVSDGDPTMPPSEVLAEFLKEKVSVSTVAIFPHGGEDISRLREIARETGGRYYFPDDAELLPSIFIKEAKTLKQTMIQERAFTPEAGLPSPVLKGITGTPPLHGYVMTSLKDGAQMLLQTPLGHDPEQDEHDPILARWRFGLGTAAAFTSDLSARWGRDWMRWEQSGALIKQLLADISRVRTPGHLRLWTYASAGEGVLLVEDFASEDTFLDLTAQINGPGGRSETQTLRQIGPRRYQARMPLWGQGRYQVIVQASGNDRREMLTGGFIVPYSPEYLRFRSDPIALDEVRAATGGTVLNASSPASDVFGLRQPRQSSRPVFDWLLIAAAILVPIDVALRRLQLNWSALREWWPWKTEQRKTTATMGALLQSKQHVSDRLASREQHPAEHRPDSTATAATTRPPDAGRIADGGSTDDTTTSRLLELKRRRQLELDGDHEEPGKADPQGTTDASGMEPSDG